MPLPLQAVRQFYFREKTHEKNKAYEAFKSKKGILLLSAVII
jgi:hypothetical protein